MFRSVPNLEELKRMNKFLEDSLLEQRASFEDTGLGESLGELKKLRDDFDQYRAEQAAYQAAAEHREKVAERRGFIKGFLSSLITAILAGLVIYYWPAITAWASSLVQ